MKNNELRERGMRTANYRLMTQLPASNLTNWVVILQNSLAVIKVKCFYDIHRVMLDNTIIIFTNQMYLIIY